MKTITSNSRTANQVAILHLFEFEIKKFDNTSQEILYFTDHDIFVKDDVGTEYTPTSITFDKLKEDTSAQTNSINLTMDNISKALTTTAFDYAWRGNEVTIKRVVYTPPSEIINGETYEFGYGDNLDVYPLLDLTGVTKDTYNLFEGYIDTFGASEQSLNATISTKFIYWQRPFPDRMYDQKEFGGIIGAMANQIYWGRLRG